MNLQFNDDNSPIPTVFVGVNGSGKSLLLSIVLEAIVMMRERAFGSSPEIESGKYFKPISSRVIANQTESYALSNCKFSHGDQKVEFLELISNKDEDGNYIKPDNFVPSTGFNESSFNKQGSSKTISVTGGDISEAVSKGVYAYYPAGRAERPNWLNKDVGIDFEIRETYRGVAQYNIWRTNLIHEVTTWILDVVLDTEIYDRTSTTIPIKVGEQELKVPGWISTPGPNRRILNHLNTLLTDINTFGGKQYKSVRLGVSPRYAGSRQVNVIGKKDNGSEDILATTVLDLSTGELMILCMFADIIRLAEKQGWDKNKLSDISGIVIIDEADLHLHINLQKNLLPKMMSQFTNIQFLLTTHSPFLSVGLSDNKVDIRNMPQGSVISPSDFSEFQIAYDTFVKQQDSSEKTYSRLQAVLNESDRPLICLLYTSPSPRDATLSRMPSSA